MMDEIISYKMCAVKVRNAKLRNYLNNVFFPTVPFQIHFTFANKRKTGLTGELTVLKKILDIAIQGVQENGNI
jgi:hypothetical protein